MNSLSSGQLVAALRAAGCVFAEEEAAILTESATDDQHLADMLTRRQAGEPLEQVVGAVAFGELTLAVDVGIFVPRQRSLALAALAISECVRRPAAAMLELCCGVAPIAAAVEQAGVAGVVVAADSHEPSLRLARKNLRTPHVYGGDLFDALPSQPVFRFDVIAAVPPYIPASEKHLLPREARDYEPAEALFGGLDGLDVVRGILATAASWLTSGGAVLLELHRTQQAAALAVARAVGLAADGSILPDRQTCLLKATLN